MQSRIIRGVFSRIFRRRTPSAAGPNLTPAHKLESSPVAPTRSCCDEDSCIRKDIANLLDPDSPVVDRVYVAATAVARTCGKLTSDELRVCAARLFESPPECDLTKAFVIAYQTERDALAGQRDIEKRRAAGQS